MKRILKVFLLFILLFPTIVLGKDTCNPNDIVIKNISISDTNGFIEEVQEANIDNNTINLDLKMYDVGDSINYNILIKNNSNKDYYFTNKSFKIDKDYFEYTLVNDSEIIKANEEKNIQLAVKYKNKASEDIYKDVNKVTISLSDEPLTNPVTRTNYSIMILVLLLIIAFSMNISKKKIFILISTASFIPITAYALCTVNIKVEAKIEIVNKQAIFLPGEQLNIKMKELAGNDISTSGRATPDTNITSIKYSKTEPDSSNKEEKNIVSTQESGYPIYMWYTDETIYWWSEDIHPNLNEDSNYEFYKISNLKNIEDLSMWDASNMKNMIFMFGGEASAPMSLKSLLPLKNWNVSNVTNMYCLFYYCPSLETVEGLENWDTSNVTDMSYLFHQDTLLADVSAIKNWDVRKVKNMRNMFAATVNLEEVDLSNWETSSLENMSNMFGMWNNDASARLDSKLKRIILSDKFDTSKVKNMYALIANNTHIEDYSFLRFLNTSNVTNMQQLFLYNQNLTNLEYIKEWDVSKVTTMQKMFEQCTSLENLSGLENWNVSNLKDGNRMFQYCTSVVNLSGLEKWNVGNLTDMTNMFYKMNNLESISALVNWNVSNVTTFHSAFYNDKKITDASSINDWDIQSTANFNYMFRYVTNHPEFTKVLGTWSSKGTFIPS